MEPDVSSPDYETGEGLLSGSLSSQGEDPDAVIAVDAREDPSHRSSNMSLFNEGESSNHVKLKDTNEVAWIDRIDFPKEYEETFMGFYNRLIEASDNDGFNDFLIEDKYLLERDVVGDGAAREKIIGVPGEFVVSARIEENPWTAIRAASIPIKTNENFDDTAQMLFDYGHAVRAAFDRDHPEVFWIRGGAIFFITQGISEYYLNLVISGYEFFSPNTDHDTVRLSSFDNEMDIKDAAELMDERIEDLLLQVGCEYKKGDEDLDNNPNSEDLPFCSDVYKVRYFNKWLTCANGYNTTSIRTLEYRCPLSFESISALIGRYKGAGPICEGYARAFKVLCDAAGVSCVIADGDGGGVSHMWNNVCIDGKWYGVDVTWDDPGFGDARESGLETENYLFAGSETVMSKYNPSETFRRYHNEENRHFNEADSLKFTNGPVIETSALEHEDLSKPLPFIYSGKAYYEHFSNMDISWLDTDMALCTVAPFSQSDYAYTSKPITPTPKVTMGGREINCEFGYENNVNVGTATLTISGKGKYIGRVSRTFRIKYPVKIASIKVSDKAYTGKKVTPSIFLKLTDSKLRRGIDFTVQTRYRNNTKVGVASATVTVKGIGEYTGEVSRDISFKIVPKRISLKKLTSANSSIIAKWKKASKAYATGYQLRYSKNSKYKTRVKTIKISKLSTVQRSIKKLKKNSRYYVSIRAYKTVKGKRFYGSWSVSKNIKLI